MRISEPCNCLRRLLPGINGRRLFNARRAGVTLTELMVAVSVLTIGVLGGMGSFKYINKAITQSRLKTIASNLAQEQMEVLRNKSYFQLLVTTATADSVGYSPNFVYDTASYPPQTITLWGFPALTRAVNVDYVSVSGSEATALPYTTNDPGMKKITVYVMWTMDGVPKKVQLDSYYENPSAAALSAGFTGTVTNIDGGAVIKNALVQVMGAPKWRAQSDSSGKYSFQVVPGTYTLVCSTEGYFSKNSNTISVSAGPYATQNFALTKVAKGSVSGMAYLRDHLVISQVVGSSITDSAIGLINQEWVEVYNPTTWTWTMATGLNAGRVGVAYKILNHSGQLIDFDYHALTVDSQHYYLFANTATITAGGTARAADAVYKNTTANYPNVIKIDADSGNDAAELTLVDLSLMQPIDKVAWKTGGNSFGGEGDPIEQSIGLQLNEQFVRKSQAGSLSSGVGRAYDTNNNNNDFSVISPIAYPPKNSTDHENAVSGTPAAGAVVTVGDGLSSSALVSATGYFLLTDIATSTVQGSTNTWTVTVASYTVLGSSAGVTVAADQNKDLGTILFSTRCAGGIATGYVFGSGPDYYKRLGSPSIKVGAGGVTTNTDGQGFYMLFLSTGTVTITANYGSSNGNYQTSDVDVTLEQGSVVQVPDFHIAQGGYITGYVTSGTGALPNIVVRASNGGPVFEDTSDSTGHFYIYATTGSVAYTVSPVLDPLQSYTSLPATPLTTNVAIAGSTVFAGTITVVGAMGTIAGTVTNGGTAITTGVLIVASTATITDPLAPVVAAVSASQSILYSISSQADGTYSLDVRSSTTTTYNMRAFYPAVDAVSGAVTYTSKTYSSVPVGAGAITQRNFSWP